MDIRLFKEFLILTQHMNFSHAAAELHMSQPTLSRHIVEMERELGQKLFNRKRPLSLTRAGEAMLRHASDIRDSYEELSEDLRGLRNSVSGTILVHNMTYYPTGLAAFTHAISELKSLYPNVSVELVDKVVHSLSDDLSDGVVDISFVFKGGRDAYQQVPDDELFSYSRVGDLPDRIIAGVGLRHGLATRDTLRLADLANIRIVRPSTLLFDSPCNGFIKLCSEHGVGVRYQLLRSDSLQQFWTQDFSHQVLTLAASYVDSGIYPVHMSRQLKIMEFEDEGLDWCMHAVCRRDTDNPAIFDFLEFLREADMPGA